MKPQSISVRIGRVVWHGHGAMPADALARAIGGAIAHRLDAAPADAPVTPEGAPLPAQDVVADTVADAVVDRLGASQGARK